MADMLPLALPPSPGLILIAAPRSVLRGAMPSWIARLAVAGTVRVLDGGNCFNAYGVAREVRRHTHHLEAALQRISISRAFTCYQVAALLADTTADARTTLVLDLLLTFADESVRQDERQRLFEGCLVHLQRLQSAAQLVVSVSLQSVAEPRWLEMIEEISGKVWRLEPSAPPPVLRLL